MSAATQERPAWMIPLADPKGRIIGGHVLNKTVFGIERPTLWSFNPEKIFDFSTALLILPPEGVNLNDLTARIHDAIQVEVALAKGRRPIGERGATGADVFPEPTRPTASSEGPTHA